MDETEASLFFESLRVSNPFASVRVSGPTTGEVDVRAIHDSAFRKLTDRAWEAERDGRGIGVALLGSAGLGKSHLLSRLSRWAEETNEDGVPRAFYLFLHNILTDPERLPRYLLKYVLSVLTRGGSLPPRRSALYLLVLRAVLRILRDTGLPRDQWTLGNGREALRRHLNNQGIDVEVGAVLGSFLRYAHPVPNAGPERADRSRAALEWLSGEEIDAQLARDLDLRPHGAMSSQLRDDQQVEQVFMALCRLALACDQPFVLCIDQVDNLDTDKLMALTRFLHVLIDHAPNLLVVIAGVKATMENFFQLQMITAAAWDRVAEYKVELNRIKRQEARQILEARLERFLHPLAGYEPVRERIIGDTLFPLGETWFEEKLADGIEFRPRDILIWARDEWERQQVRLEQLNGPDWLATWPGERPERRPPISASEAVDVHGPTDARIERKISELVARHKQEGERLPCDAGNLAALVHELLRQAAVSPSGGKSSLVVERLMKQGGRLPCCDLLIRAKQGRDERETTTGVLFVTNEGKGATAALKRLLYCDRPLNHRVLVTDEDRRPLSVGEQGRDCYDKLTELGDTHFRHIKLTFQEYAELNALVEVIGEARAGDLEIELAGGEIRPVSAKEVIASLHRQQRFQSHPLLRYLLPEYAGEGSPG